jgi:hypothetical protein
MRAPAADIRNGFDTFRRDLSRGMHRRKEMSKANLYSSEARKAAES